MHFVFVHKQCLCIYSVNLFMFVVVVKSVNLFLVCNRWLLELIWVNLNIDRPTPVWRLNTLIELFKY